MSPGLHLRKKLINKSNKFIFFYPGNIKQKTGGYIYENNIYEYSKKNNISIHFNELSDNYPFPSNKDLKYLNNIITNLHSDKILIFDGLVLEGLAKEEYIFNNFKTIALIHHPLYLEFRGKKSDHFLDIANKIYKKVDYFIVTSSDTKKLLSKKFKINSNIISIVEPGIEELKKARGLLKYDFFRATGEYQPKINKHSDRLGYVICIGNNRKDSLLNALNAISLINVSVE